MCGITGWFGTPLAAETAKENLSHMLSAISHRGPDAKGTFLVDNAALGHVRLSIIDLEKGHQPMEVNGVVISFNGEIYNYQLLRKELSNQGYRFRTHSDTEVILAIYHNWGWQAFSRLRGMYAFALWDKSRQCGLLVRDPLGIKPLFFSSLSDGSVLFGSEAKALLASGLVNPALDEVSLHLLLNFRYLPGDRSMFQQIRQLRPGGVLLWTPNGIRQTSLSTQRIDIITPSQAILESVKAHMTADVEVGAYLSGGIDSGIIVALARKHGLKQTFTLEVGDDRHEAENAARTARLLQVENLRRPPSTNIEQRLHDLVWSLEVPKINSLQASEVAILAASRVKVVLSGLGGDELFYGYRAHSIMAQVARLRSLLPVQIARICGTATSQLLAALQKFPNSEAQRAAMMLQQLGAWPKVYGLLRNVWDSKELRARIYGPRLLEAELPDAFEFLEQVWPDLTDPLESMAQFEFREKLVNDLLWQEDRVSMAVGLEVRTPLVDQVVVASMHGMDRRTLMPGGKRKGYLKQVASAWLPNEILERPKSGFQVDAPQYFNQWLRPIAMEQLNRKKVREYGLFNPSFVNKLLTAPVKTRYRWHYFTLYLMLMTHIWMDEFTHGECRN